MGRSIIYDNLPSISSPQGFFFYAFLGYMVIKFLMFMIRSDPEDLIEESEREIQSKLTKERGMAKRDENKQGT